MGKKSIDMERPKVYLPSKNQSVWKDYSSVADIVQAYLIKTSQLQEIVAKNFASFKRKYCENRW